MKKTRILSILFGFLLLLIPVTMVFGQIAPQAIGPGNNGANQAIKIRTLDDVLTLIQTISVWFLSIVVAVSVIIVVWGGFTFMTSGGDDNKVKEGRDRILWGVVGLAVALLAKSVVALVEALVG